MQLTNQFRNLNIFFLSQSDFQIMEIEEIIMQLNDDIENSLQIIFDRYGLKIKYLKIIETGRSLSGDIYKVRLLNGNLHALFVSCIFRFKNNNDYLKLIDNKSQIKELLLQVGEILTAEVGVQIVDYDFNPFRIDIKRL